MHAITFLDSTRNSAQIIAKHFEEGFKDSSFVCSSQSPVSGTLRSILFHLHLPVSAFFYSNPVCPSQSLPFRGRCAWYYFIFTYRPLLFLLRSCASRQRPRGGRLWREENVSASQYNRTIEVNLLIVRLEDLTGQ